MANSTYFLRDGYTQEEKISRIPSGKVRPGIDPVDRALNQLGDSDVSNLSKRDFFYRAKEKLEDEEFQNLIDDLFESWGKRGDPFNLQTFSISQNISPDKLIDACERLKGGNLEGAYSSILSEPLSLDSYSMGENQEHLDLAFKTAEKVEDLEPTEEMPIRVVRKDGEEEYDYGPEWEVIAPTRTAIEARVYFESSLASISNASGVRDGTQTDIVAVINKMGSESS